MTTVQKAQLIRAQLNAVQTELESARASGMHVSVINFLQGEVSRLGTVYAEYIAQHSICRV